MSLQDNHSYTPDQLIAGDFPLVDQAETLITGQNLKRGAVLGRIAASGKLTLSLSAAVDGSQDPMGVLAVDADATAADVTVPVYKSGEFDGSKLILGAGHDVASVTTAFEGTPLFVQSVSDV